MMWKVRNLVYADEVVTVGNTVVRFNDYLAMVPDCAVDYFRRISNYMVYDVPPNCEVYDRKAGSLNLVYL